MASRSTGALAGSLGIFRPLLVHRGLIAQLVRREVAGRYQGSFLGVFWSLVNPLVMLAIYTFVFGMVFKSRWRTGSTDPLEFAVVMFAGILVHNFISECIQRAPLLVVGQPNFVKKVVFPLETLPWVAIGSALFHTLVAAGIFVAAVLLWQHHLPPTILLLPLVFVPYVVLVIGLVWLLSALGVFLRDLAQIMGIASSLLMFLAPVFYPLQSVPERWRPLLYLNPLTFIVEQVRAVAIWGEAPNWAGWLVYLAVAWLIAAAGLAFFRRSSKGFADVL